MKCRFVNFRTLQTDAGTLRLANEISLACAASYYVFKMYRSVWLVPRTNMIPSSLRFQAILTKERRMILRSSTLLLFR